MSPVSEPDFILNKIQLELSELRSTLIPSEILLRELENVKKHQEENKQDLKEIKRMLLDPNDGIIVKVNKNTEFREDQENENKEYEKLLREHEEIMKWKSGIIKFLWIAVSGIFASIGYIFSELRNP
jgi:predicted butyrate kinase (DUF1464 family)